MARFLLKALIPVVAAALLDRYCILRDARRIKHERKSEIARWEGEGGPPADVQAATGVSPVSA